MLLCVASCVCVCVGVVLHHAAIQSCGEALTATRTNVRALSQYLP